MDDTEPWHAFWLASELAPATGPELAARINEFDPTPGPSRFTYATGAHRLERPADPLSRLLAERRSARSFGTGPLPGRSLGSLLGAFADPAEGRRAWPSAGGLYPLEVFAFLIDVDHPLGGRAVHYEPGIHGLTDVGAAPAWEELRTLTSADVLASAPQLVVAFVLDTVEMERKYGNRAGRFALVEVGHAAQNLALRLAADGMAGCELGGTYDRALLRWLALDERPRVRLALAYACGLPDRPRRRGLGRVLGS